VETGWLAPKPKAPLRRLVNARALDLKKCDPPACSSRRAGQGQRKL